MKMKNKMKTIIAATDFSPAALNAARYAADMALAIHADLLLLHIAALPSGFGGMLMANTSKAIVQKAEDKMQEQVNYLLNILVPGKLEIFTEVRLGSFQNELIDVCEKEKPYAVVMGSQGTTATERFLFGGHSVNTMRNLSWPVITVPPEVSFSSIKKIAFACDFNKTSSAPVDDIKILATEFNAELHIINTGRKDGIDPAVSLKTAWLRMGLAPVKPIYHFIDDVNTDTAIVNFAETNDIDLLVVLPKRPGLLDRLLYTSTSKHLVLNCHVPVVALHE